MRRILLLDVMDTVVVDPFFRGAEQFFGLDFDTMLAAIRPGAWVRFERGETDERTYLGEMFLDGRSVDGEALRAWMTQRYRYVPGMDGLLDDLVAAEVPMHALSNYPVWYRWVDSALRLSDRLPWTFVSCNTGRRKPDAAAYLEAASALGVAPSACVFVDDRGENCKAAAAAGMTAIRFTTADALRAALRGHGLPGAEHHRD